MQALILGSIGVLAETSDIQRDAFNRAFAEAGLDWHWDREEYSRMLLRAGGRDRIAAQATARDRRVDVDALHARKSELFRKALADGLPLRPGVAETMEAARARGWKLGFVTTTSRANVEAVLGATGLSRDDFDLVTDVTDATAPKPAPDIYVHALLRLEASPEDAVAVEDNPDGLKAARAAGLDCLAFPGALHRPEAFEGAAAVLDRLVLPGDLAPA